MSNNQVKKSNPLLDIIFNIAIPSLILIKFSSPEKLGQLNAFLLALLFPFLFGIYELIKSKKFSGLAAFGVLNVLLTGGLGLFKFDGFWFAVKESSIPAVIGLVVVFYSPLTRKLIFNDQIMNIEKIEEVVKENNAHDKLDKLMNKTKYLLGSSFLLSSILNFTLAIIILKSPSGTVEFNQELGKMNMLSYPVIMVPCMIILIYTIFNMTKGIKEITGLSLEEVLVKKS